MPISVYSYQSKIDYQRKRKNEMCRYRGYWFVSNFPNYNGNDVRTEPLSITSRLGSIVRDSTNRVMLIRGVFAMYLPLRVDNKQIWFSNRRIFEIECEVKWKQARNALRNDNRVTDWKTFEIKLALVIVIMALNTKQYRTT